MSKTLALYHIVFCTRRRLKTLVPSCHESVYRYITSFLKERKCHLYQVNGTENHIHLLIDLHPNIALSSLVRDMKAYSSKLIKESGWSLIFDGWAKEYYACTISPSHIDSTVRYIANQKEHHDMQDFDMEIEWLHKKVGLTYYISDLYE